MNLLAVDVGTTHCKVGLFSVTGHLLASDTRPTPGRRTAGGYVYDPEELWQQLCAAIRQTAGSSPPVAAIAITSMAETGLLLARDKGRARTPFYPWFDTQTAAQAEELRRAADVAARFSLTGMRPIYKCALARLLWLRERDRSLLQNAVWLSVADYLVYRLTAVLATDYSLAGRTYTFNVNEKRWDTGWLQAWNLAPDLFPQTLPAGTEVGQLTPQSATSLGVRAGIPVTIAGHDHVCAALAAGAVQPGTVFDSMGTAETLVGTLPGPPLVHAAFDSGLTYGCHVAPETYYWMGGLSTSGGSLEWLRDLLDDPPLTYEALEQMVARLPPGPSSILYFPYLAGSGSPHPDARVRAAFVGLSRQHDRAHVLKAVLEGTAYEMEWIRRVAQRVTGVPIKQMVVAGGGTRNRTWLQIKADVSGCRLRTLPIADATLLGAAVLAGLAAGVYENVEQALSQPGLQPTATVIPDHTRHRAYRHHFEHGYRPLQEPLRKMAATLSDEQSEQTSTQR